MTSMTIALQNTVILTFFVETTPPFGRNTLYTVLEFGKTCRNRFFPGVLFFLNKVITSGTGLFPRAPLLIEVIFTGHLFLFLRMY